MLTGLSFTEPALVDETKQVTRKEMGRWITVEYNDRF
jgi:hypothetical protein